MSKYLLAALLAAGAATSAQAQQQEAIPEIVVEGVRDQDKEIGRFVDALTDAPFTGQLSKFDWAVCPAAVGLGDAQNRIIAERIRKVAAAGGVPVAAPDCRPNVLLLVARDKRDLIEQLHRKHPAYFKGLTRDDVRGLARSDGPAAAWHVEGRLDADGAEVPRDPITGTYVVERTDMASRLTTAWRPHFMAAVVVVELDSLAGLTLTQLADYAALRAFTNADPERLDNTSAPTILTVLEAPMNSAVPVTLTEWDMAFLKGLYASTENRRAGRQRSEIKRLVREDLRREPAGE